MVIIHFGFSYVTILLSGVEVSQAFYFFSYVTSPSWIPDPLFRLHIDRMHRVGPGSSTFCEDTSLIYEIQAVHGSDSRTYTHRGELDESRFDEIFNTYTYPPNNNITFWQGVKMIRGNANPFDPVK